MNYVACLKWGNKYGPEYVNRLHSMVSRHLSTNHEFVCFTEDRKGIDSNVNILPLPSINMQGWWYKPYMFSNEFDLEGTLLFLDLDVVICNNIDKLFSYEPGEFCIIRDFNRKFRSNWNRMNSSVFRTPIGKYQNLWENFKNNPRDHTSRNRGDQDWMFKNVRDHVFWPDSWIQSYKWEIRDKRDLSVTNGRRNFEFDAPPKLTNDLSIAVFHGEPNPADCKDQWVQQHWT